MLPSISRVSAWRQLGKVALGDRSGKNGAPMDLNYFVLKEKRPSDAKYYRSDAYHAILGDKPQVLDIMLPFETWEETIRDRAVMYGSNGLRQCYTDDAVRAHRRRKAENGKMEWHEIACPSTECEFRNPRMVDGNLKPAACKEKAIFTFMIPAIDIGTFHMDFGSRVGAKKIYSALVTISEICSSQGRPNGIRGIRCKLVREATAFDVDGRRVIKHIPNIQIDYASLMQSDKMLLGPFIGKAIDVQAPLAITMEQAEAMDAEVEE